MLRRGAWRRAQALCGLAPSPRGPSPRRPPLRATPRRRRRRRPRRSAAARPRRTTPAPRRTPRPPPAARGRPRGRAEHARWPPRGARGAGGRAAATARHAIDHRHVDERARVPTSTPRRAATAPSSERGSSSGAPYTNAKAGRAAETFGERTVGSSSAPGGAPPGVRARRLDVRGRAVGLAAGEQHERRAGEPRERAKGGRVAVRGHGGVVERHAQERAPGDARVPLDELDLRRDGEREIERRSVRGIGEGPRHRHDPAGEPVRHHEVGRRGARLGGEVILEPRAELRQRGTSTSVSVPPARSSASLTTSNSASGEQHRHVRVEVRVNAATDAPPPEPAPRRAPRRAARARRARGGDAYRGRALAARPPPRGERRAPRRRRPT